MSTPAEPTTVEGALLRLRAAYLWRRVLHESRHLAAAIACGAYAFWVDGHSAMVGSSDPIEDAWIALCGPASDRLELSVLTPDERAGPVASAEAQRIRSVHEARAAAVPSYKIESDEQRARRRLAELPIPPQLQDRLYADLERLADRLVRDPDLTAAIAEPIAGCLLEQGRVDADEIAEAEAACSPLALALWSVQRPWAELARSYGVFPCGPLHDDAGQPSSGKRT